LFYAYVLYSEKAMKHYYGSTGDLHKRLNEHNRGKVKFTKPFIPWCLVYSEEYESRSDAFKREMFFKSVDGHRWLKEHQII
jgi:putative endonuclease